MNNHQHPATRSELAPSNDGAGSGNNQTLPLLQSCAPQEWPTEIIVEPSRLAVGIWGDNEGDINAAYCADTFPKIKVFLHQGQRYTNSGGTNDCAICFPLIPSEEYKGPPQKPYSYEGRTAVYENQSFTLGPKIKFVARARTLQEEVSLLQRQYAYGGLFAAGKTYREMLLEFLEDEEISQGLTVAIEAELARETLPATQSEMLQQLGKLTDNMDGNPSVSQTTLPGF